MDVEALYQAYAPALLAFVASRLPDREAAEDLHHTVWVRFLAGPRDLAGEHARRWLFTVARNLLVDHWRRPEARKRAAELPPEFPAPEAEAADPDDRLARLRRCLAQLSPDYRAVVEARFAGESSAETAVRLHIAPALVDTRYHKAKDRLRACAGGPTP